MMDSLLRLIINQTINGRLASVAMVMTQLEHSCLSLMVLYWQEEILVVLFGSETLQKVRVSLIFSCGNSSMTKMVMEFQITTIIV